MPWAFFSAEKCWMRASAETPKPAVLPVTSPAHLQSTDAPCYSLAVCISHLPLRPLAPPLRKSRYASQAAIGPSVRSPFEVP